MNGGKNGGQSRLSAPNPRASAPHPSSLARPVKSGETPRRGHGIRTVPGSLSNRPPCTAPAKGRGSSGRRDSGDGRSGQPRPVQRTTDCSPREVSWLTPHPAHTALAPAAEAHRLRLREVLSDDGLAAIRTYLKPQHALGRDSLRAMVEAENQRLVGCALPIGHLAPSEQNPVRATTPS